MVNFNLFTLFEHDFLAPLDEDERRQRQCSEHDGREHQQTEQ